MIFLENISSRITEQEIRQHFSTFGRIVDFIFQPNVNTGELEAYIEFEHVVI